ncbi:hypothetical protein CMV37_34430 [Bacillus cereus]|nr:hypothetical protein CMV37_34430 [Bacillus cereus]
MEKVKGKFVINTYRHQNEYMIYLKVDSLFEIRNRLFIIIFFVSCFSKNNSYYQWLFFKKALTILFMFQNPVMITVDQKSGLYL